MMQSPLGGFILFGFLTLFSCNTGQEDISAPEITISSPEDKAIFANGSTISIQASITENQELHSYVVRILTPGNGEVQFEREKHEHGQNIQVDESFTPDIKLDTDFLLRIEAEDHHGNSNTIEHTFQVSQ